MPGRFETAGRAVDRELTRVIKFLDREVRPTTQRGASTMLRRAAQMLNQLATRVERRQRKLVRGQKPRRKKTE